MSGRAAVQRGPATDGADPEGAVLIENPVSIAPGFSLENVHVMAGVPRIFEAMVASVLPTLTGGAPLLSQNLRLMRGEGEIATDFGALAAAFPDLSMGSYPFTQNGAYGTNLVIRGTDPAAGFRGDAEAERVVSRVMTPAQLQQVMDSHMASASMRRLGPWLIRDGAGGGKRVSAASAEGTWHEADIEGAEAAMRALAQPELFLIRQGETALDAALQRRGYRIVDPVLAYAAAVADIAATPPARMTSFPHWPPMEIARQFCGGRRHRPGAGGGDATGKRGQDRAAGPASGPRRSGGLCCDRRFRGDAARSGGYARVASARLRRQHVAGGCGLGAGSGSGTSGSGGDCGQ